MQSQRAPNAHHRGVLVEKRGFWQPTGQENLSSPTSHRAHKMGGTKRREGRREGWKEVGKEEVRREREENQPGGDGKRRGGQKVVWEKPHLRGRSRGLAGRSRAASSELWGA